MATDTPHKMPPMMKARAHKANTEEAIAAHLTRLESDTGLEVCGVIVLRDDGGRLAVAITAEV